MSVQRIHTTVHNCALILLVLLYVLAILDTDLLQMVILAMVKLFTITSSSHDY